MHELAIAASVVEAVLAKTGDQLVRVVRLRVGQLSGVLPDALAFSFEVAADGTTLQGARLLIEQPAGRLRCRQCHGETGRDDLILLCDCGSADVEVIAGRELSILDVEVV